jgi:RNA polymerase sigma-70 factor (ECF subfamily)
MTLHASHPESKPLSLAEEDDRTLAASVASGKRVAFEQPMRRYNRRLYRLARATLRDDAEAEDALQEAYLAAFRAIPCLRGGASLSTWLSRLMLNECLTRQRHGTRRDRADGSRRADRRATRPSGRVRRIHAHPRADP